MRKTLIGAMLVAACGLAVTASGATAATKSVSQGASSVCWGDPTKTTYAWFSDNLDYTATRVTVTHTENKGKVFGCYNGYSYQVDKLKMVNDFGYYGAKIGSCTASFPWGVSCTGTTSERHATITTGPKSSAANIEMTWTNLVMWADSGGYFSSYSHQNRVVATNNGNDHGVTAAQKVGL